MGRSFLSEDGVWGITWTGSPEETIQASCLDAPITISEQGVPFRILRRLSPHPEFKLLEKFRAKRDVQLPAEQPYRPNSSNPLNIHPMIEEMNSHLQAVLMITERNAKKRFQETLYQVCQNVRSLAMLVQANIINSPTLAVRSLLNRPNLISRPSGSSFIEVIPCTALEPETYKFLPMTGQCTEYIPIQFSFEGVDYKGFFNPANNAIFQHSPRASCNLVRTSVIVLDDSPMKYIAETGTLHPLPVTSQLALWSWNASLNQELYTSTIFKGRSMYTYLEQNRPIDLNDLAMSFVQQRDMFRVLGLNFSSGENPSNLASAFSQRISEMSLAGMLFGFLPSPFQIFLWITLAVVWIQIVVKCLKAAYKAPRPRRRSPADASWAYDHAPEQMPLQLLPPPAPLSGPSSTVIINATEPSAPPDSPQPQNSPPEPSPKRLTFQTPEPKIATVAPRPRARSLAAPEEFNINNILSPRAASAPLANVIAQLREATFTPPPPPPPPRSVLSSKQD